MNNEGSHRYGERSGEERAVELLRDAVTRLEASRGDPGESVERSLARGTDRLFSCGSPLGEVYVGVSEGGVRLVGRAASPEEFARRYRERFGRLLSWGTGKRTRRLAERVAAALAGKKVEVPADLSRTTPFQRRVLEVVKGGPPRGGRAHPRGAKGGGLPK